MRDASSLAVSVLAEIVEAYQRKVRSPLSSTAIACLRVSAQAMDPVSGELSASACSTLSNEAPRA